MAYIYKIINDINDKVYIGQTRNSLKERFQYHLYASMKENNLHRPLYLAMKKYGFNHFSIEQIEECSEEELDEREKYWIAYYNSYNDGYNATIGGNGFQGFQKFKPVDMFDKEGNFEQHFESIKAACDFIGNPKAKQHISKVCHGERVTAYGHKWKFSNEEDEKIEKTFCKKCGKQITKGHLVCLYCNS